jgi:DNA repair protein RadC
MAKTTSKVATAARLVVKRERVVGVKLPTKSLVLSPNDAAQAALDLIGDNAYEVFLILYLDVRNVIIGYEELTEGSISGVSVNSSSVVRNALLAGAPAVVTVHNHPSGALDPSLEDRQLWARLKSELTALGITLLDNLIVGGSGFFSESEGSPQALIRKRKGGVP